MEEKVQEIMVRNPQDIVESFLLAERQRFYNLFK